MILKGYILGRSVLGGFSPAPPTSDYNKITVYGDSQVDKIHVLNRVLTDQELNAIDYREQTIWTPDTLLLAEFQTLFAGNAEGLTNPATNWEIFRRISDETIFTRLAELPISQTSYTDYTVGGDQSYIYRIFALNDEERTVPLETEATRADFYIWSLVDENTGTVYLFNLNLDSGSIDSNTDFNIYDEGYTQYSATSYSQKDYISGSISAIGGVINSDGKHVFARNYIKDLQTFINNREEKLLKSRNGEVWRVTTDGFRFAFEDNLTNLDSPITSQNRFQPARVSFNFVEVGEV